MQKKFLILILLIAFLAVWFTYAWWSSAIRQPLNFSHSLHVKNQISCSSCHGEKVVKELPSPPLCKKCHEQMVVPERVEWVRVYRVAPDIIFGHQYHETIPCKTCHDQFTSAKSYIHETRFKMDFCMDCHAQSGAKNECRTCHTNR